MGLSLCAPLLVALAAYTAAYFPEYTTYRIENAYQVVMGSVDSNATVFAPAMEMDLWGGIRKTDRPATPHGEWDEDLFVDLVKEIQMTLLRTGALDNASITWLPHDIDPLTFPPGVDVDPRVVSLMRRLPIAEGYGNEIIPMMLACGHVGDNRVYSSRFIDERNWMYEEEYKVVLAPPQAFEWLCLAEENMPRVILDVEKNTIHEVGEYHDLRDAFTETHEQWWYYEKLRDYRCEYRNWPTMSAPEYLRSILRNLREGVWLPSTGRGLMVLSPGRGGREDRERFALVSKRTRLLMEVYGWPDEFREEDWKKEVVRSPREDEDWDFWLKLLD